jgi:hypothetical protein
LQAELFQQRERIRVQSTGQGLPVLRNTLHFSLQTLFKKGGIVLEPRRCAQQEWVQSWSHLDCNALMSLPRLPSIARMGAVSVPRHHRVATQLKGTDLQMLHAARAKLASNVPVAPAESVRQADIEILERPLPNRSYRQGVYAIQAWRR